jgi:hypothetical protein
MYKTELPKGNSVTYRLFGEEAGGDDLDLDADAGDAGGDEEAGAKDDGKTYLYIDDVIKEAKIHYFKLPKLGCYMAVPLNYQSCLNPLAFEEAYKDKLRYDQDVA